MARRRVKFIRSYGPYNAGERAGFDEHVAQDLVDGTPAYAVYDDLEQRAQTAPPVDKSMQAEQRKSHDDEDAPVPDRDHLYSLTNRELRDLLSEQDKPVYGAKDALVSRLMCEEE